MDDLQISNPTVFGSVPRLYNKVNDGIMQEFKKATGIQRFMVNKALESKLQNLKYGLGHTHWFWDRLIFNKVRAKLGGNVKVMVTGSAPIAGDTLSFLKVCFCCPLFEGYGMTESMGGSSMTSALDPKAGHVGGPLANCKVRLKDIPEMDYYTYKNPP